MVSRSRTIALLAVAVVVLALLAVGIASDYDALSNRQPQMEADQGYLPPVGSNEIFREATAAAEGHELIAADLLLPADAVGEPHSHPWEEYLYVLDGSAVLDIEGMEERTIEAGESAVLPRETVHTPRAGPNGIRAIIIRVHDEGDPIMVPATE